mmetsp:Transcript_41567/g.126008  ORF Transcript_41567/g.126008 Transcript_41567/m.126008 type:complete len:485 (+) Transcript_41567:530-1984(+)
MAEGANEGYHSLNPAPIENLERGKIRATGLPTTRSLGSVPNTRESTETALQSPNTYTSSSPSLSIYLPFPSIRSPSMSLRGSSAQRFLSGPTAGAPFTLTSCVTASMTIASSPGIPTILLTKRDSPPSGFLISRRLLDAAAALFPPRLTIMSLSAGGASNNTTSPLRARLYAPGNFSTSSTSPLRNVGSIDALGMSYSETKFRAVNASGTGARANARKAAAARPSERIHDDRRGRNVSTLNRVRAPDDTIDASTSTGQSVERTPLLSHIRSCVFHPTGRRASRAADRSSGLMSSVENTGAPSASVNVMTRYSTPGYTLDRSINSRSSSLLAEGTMTSPARNGRPDGSFDAAAARITAPAPPFFPGGHEKLVSPVRASKTVTFPSTRRAPPANASQTSSERQMDDPQSFVRPAPMTASSRVHSVMADDHVSLDRGSPPDVDTFRGTGTVTPPSPSASSPSPLPSTRRSVHAASISSPYSSGRYRR